MLRSALFVAVLAFIAGSAQAVEAGYSLTHSRERTDKVASVRGFEGRINFGAGNTRYSGDRWSLAIGYVPRRRTNGDHWIPLPTEDTDYGHTDHVESYSYVNFSHRWYTRPSRFQKLPQLRIFVGTGVAWRDAHTCVDRGICWQGTPFVSNRWAFHQTFGFKWRERLEVALEHDSTGKLSRLNIGDDVFRLTLYPMIGRRSR